MKKINFKKIAIVGATACSLMSSLTACNRATAQVKKVNSPSELIVKSKNNHHFNKNGLTVDLKEYKENYVITTKVAKKCHYHVLINNIKNGKTNRGIIWLYSSKNAFNLHKYDGRYIYQTNKNGAHVSVFASYNGHKTIYTILTTAKRRYLYNYACNVSKHKRTDGVTFTLGEDASR